METQSKPDELGQVLARVRRLEIKIQRLINSNFTGEYHSAFKGSGLEFDEVRAYQYGDDIRSIDWNVSARMNQLFIKVFKEERELNLYVLLDLSGSETFGDAHRSKWSVALELTALLGFCTLRNNDRFGLFAFSDTTELHVPPGKGRNHILRIVGSLYKHIAISKKTSLNYALEHVRRSVKRRSILFILSDFLDKDYETALRAVSFRHDVILIRLHHPGERLQHFEGLLPTQSLESPQTAWIRSAGPNQDSAVQQQFQQIHEHLDLLAQKFSMGYMNLNIENDYLPMLEKFFTSNKHARLSNSTADTAPNVR